jgi:hypothetical protein
MSKTEWVDIIIAIDNGSVDDRLTMIHEALKSRVDAIREEKAETARAEISVGCKVTLHGLKPKYVNGKTATVVKINQTRVVVLPLPDQHDRRFRGEVTVPLSCVTRIKEEALV